MGAKTFVFASFPRHQAMERFGRQCAIMEAACKDLGLRFAEERACDPVGDNFNLCSGEVFVLQRLPLWIQQYSPNGERIAVFVTNDGHIEPAIKKLLASRNGLFVEADLPSPLMGYPGALGLDLQTEFAQDQKTGDANFPAILKKVEDAVIAKGGAGRFGCWAYSYGYTVSAGLGEYAIRVLNGKAKKNNLKDLLAAYAKWTPGAGWAGAPYTDATGWTFDNLALVYMDTYILGGLNGEHYLRTTKVKVLKKYLTMPSKYASQ